MKRNSKSLLSIIVTVILALSFVLPTLTISALSAPPTITPAAPYYVGDVLTVTGLTGEVTSGSDVQYYWDYVTGPNALLLNTSQGKPDGSYSAEVTIPESIAGNHYVWVKDVATGGTISSAAIVVSSSIEVEEPSGLPGDKIDVEAHAYGDTVEVWFGFYNTTWWTSTNLTTAPGTVETDDYGYASCM
jgi:signal peptidase I